MDNIGSKFSISGGLMELVATGLQNFKNKLDDAHYVSQLYGDSLIRTSQCRFSQIITRQADVIKPISLQIYFKHKISDMNLREYIGNHLAFIDFNISGGTHSYYKIDKFLLINLTPKIIKLSDNCIDINIPWGLLSDIKLIAMMMTAINIRIETLVSNMNEVTDIIFASEYTLLDTQPRQEMAQNIHHEILTEFFPIVYPYSNTIKLNIPHDGNTIKLLITSDKLLPKISNIHLNTHIQIPHKISENMYSISLINQGVNGKADIEINFEGEGNNILIYKVSNIDAVIQLGLIHTTSNMPFFNETSSLPCIFPSPPETLIKHKFKQQLLQSDKDELLDSILKNIVIEL